jgi:hypothetical protein
LEADVSLGEVDDIVLLFFGELAICFAALIGAKRACSNQLVGHLSPVVADKLSYQQFTG